jgi:hypothetical protein
MRAPKRCLLLAALAPGLCLGAGCGGGDAASGTDVASATAPASAQAPAHYATASDLRRDLANGVRQGLYRLAVMSQPPDDASDLGQQLPTGTVERVDCAAAGTRPGTGAAWPWRCRVGWRTVGGASRTTRYDVRLLANGCFAAGAVPRYPDHRDTSIASYSEHPLNAIASVRRGC